MSVLDINDVEADNWLTVQLRRPVAVTGDDPSNGGRRGEGPVMAVADRGRGEGLVMAVADRGRGEGPVMAVADRGRGEGPVMAVADRGLGEGLVMAVADRGRVERPVMAVANRGQAVRAAEPGRLHLLLGDSIARDSGMRTTNIADDLFNLARSSETWSRTRRHLPGNLDAWRTAASAFGMELGAVVVWLTGNDVYGRRRGLPGRKDDATLNKIKEEARLVVRDIKRVTEEVVILGPLPRLANDLYGATYGSTAAFHMERALLKTDYREGGVEVVPMGRALCKKISHQRAGICPGCAVWFRRDRVHLSRAGYDKVGARLPDWLEVGDSE